MNAEQFQEIVKHGNKLNKEQVNQMIKVHENFPYFQVPNVLLAKYEHQHTKGKGNEFLPWAAISSPNRQWLKHLLENDIEFSSQSNYAGNQPTDQKIQEEAEKSFDLVPEPSQDPSPSQRASILKKLDEDLHQKSQQDPSNEIPEKKVIRRKKAKRVGTSDDLIETIKKKEKKEIIDSKKKEQIDIIKAFSKKEIKLATIKEIENVQKQEDLSENSTKLNPNIISEAFAKLLVKQGKKGKAKEIYKKLIVKFPNKSTYFADLIKELEE
ncbi:hypothetical protein ACFOUP_15855 [Belliella kenyensis]|uniref:Tetratricopeptide repeat protein n=1 Tax=Belliella kenyensis TaxID=1472724 RepID=A0ABV8ENG4_9BACT|nr:hypothetical protein [Belliella kenyensis]MCH7401967.1 hypothetical protein [Belliella kenyensis]MDN3605131.1 hypothetical protein [Belliella kenyensis]